MNTYRTQLFHNQQWQSEKMILATGVYSAAEKAMLIHIREDFDMMENTWEIRVELEYKSGEKYWSKYNFTPRIEL